MKVKRPKLKPGQTHRCHCCGNEYSTDDNPELCLNVIEGHDVRDSLIQAVNGLLELMRRHRWIANSDEYNPVPQALEAYYKATRGD